MNALTIRPLVEEDRPLLHEIRSNLETWLAARGYEDHSDPHWSTKAHAAIDLFHDQRRFIGLVDQGETVAVGALGGPDMNFWTADDDLHSAWYIARVMVVRHGSDYGAQLIEIVAMMAAAAGRRYLRLDCMRENTRLHEYYLRRGFRLVRIAHHPDRESGALFERDVTNLLPATTWDGLPLRPNAALIGTQGNKADG